MEEIIALVNATNYSRMDQVKFVEDSLYFLKAFFHKFYSVHS